jgi:hypothetical protein
MNHDVLVEMIHQLNKYLILVKLAACTFTNQTINKTIISFSHLKAKNIYAEQKISTVTNIT